MRYGIWLYPDAPVHRLVEAIAMAETAGFDEVWVADEGVGREPFVVLAAAAARTATIRLAVGVTTPLLRHPGAIAAAVSTLDELAGGRAVLGLGVGGEESLGPFGIEVARPLATMERAIETVRAVLAGVEGRGYRPPRHAAPGRAVPVYVGARGERMNRLAARLADGVFLSGFEPGRLDEVVGWVRPDPGTGDGRRPVPIQVALYQSVRFTTRGDDPTAMSGDPARVAGALAELAARHRPSSLGMALVDLDDPVEMVERAALVRSRLT